MHTKYRGLLLLKAFLKQCPLDIFEQKATLWINLCTKVCAQRKPGNAVGLAYDVLGDILEISVHIPELAKSIPLSKIIETIF